jgi:SAM-dependent methyltransferase
MDEQDKGQRALHRIRKLTSPVVKEVASGVTGIPFLGDMVEGMANLVRHTPRVLTKDGLYKRGLIMLRRARKSIVALNTVTSEDAQKYVLDWGDSYQKEYFEQLFRIVQNNRHQIRTSLRIMRFTDLNDVQKAEEAISLLIYGSDIEICHSTMPIEFLIRDGEEVLLGFPDDNELSLGVRIKSEDVCATLNKWIIVQTGSIYSSPPQQVTEPKSGAVVEEKYKIPPTPSGGGITSAQELGNSIRKSRNAKGKSIDDHSLLHALELMEGIGTTDSTEAAQKAFDQFHRWYPYLYDEAECQHSYKALASWVKELTSTEPPVFLDVGCAHGIGSEFLDKEGIDYWGVDVSTALLNKARLRSPRMSNRFVAGDMIKLLLQPGKEFNSLLTKGVRSSLPNKFDVIACQGNTFDFFLGDLQKWFALRLFKSRLNERGLLFFTQCSFTKSEPRVERKIPGPDGQEVTIVYDLHHQGHFIKLDVLIDGKLDGSVVQHPTDRDWLREQAEKEGFKFIDQTGPYLGKWFAPRGGKAYDIFLFQLTV